MRKIIITIALTLFSAFSYSQWQTIYYPVSTGTLPGLNCVYFVNFNKGMAAGQNDDSNPIVIRTFDNGSTWDTVFTTNDTFQFEKIIFIDSITAFAVGINWDNFKGIIAKTNNFGSTWDTIVINDGLFSVDFPSYSTGYAVGVNGGIYKTVDCGINWSKLNSGVSNIFRATCFINDSIGFILGDSLILKTIDGGINWTITDLGVGNYFGTRSMTFASDSVGFCFFSNDTTKIFKTTNRGNTWNLYSSHYSFNFSNSIFFTDNNTGYLCGWFKMEKTIDGGLNWFNQTSGPPSSGDFFDWVADVYFLNKDTGFAVGPSQFYRTFNGGNELSEYSNQSFLINAYPNPFNEYTHISFSNPEKEKYSLSLFDSKGQIVKRIDNIVDEVIKIDKSGLKHGFYFFRLQNDSGNIGSGKLIIN